MMSAPNSTACWKEGIVFSGACKGAPRWPVARTCLKSGFASVALMVLAPARPAAEDTATKTPSNTNHIACQTTPTRVRFLSVHHRMRFTHQLLPSGAPIGSLSGRFCPSICALELKRSEQKLLGASSKTRPQKNNLNLIARLEDELERELHHPRVARKARNLTEPTARDVVVGPTELRRVE